MCLSHIYGILSRDKEYFEGQEDLVSRLRTHINRMVTLILPIITLVGKFLDSPRNPLFLDGLHLARLETFRKVVLLLKGGSEVF